MKTALALILMLASPSALAASGSLDANFLLLVIATICWFLTAVPMPDPWRGHQPNLLALGLFFFGLSMIVR